MTNIESGTTIGGRSAEDAAERVRQELKALVSKCLLVLGLPQDEVKLRANVFLPIEDRMRLLFHYNMDSPEDGDRTMEFPDLESGLTGFCYTSRRPQVCNLQEVHQLRIESPDLYKDLFGMPPEIQGKVREDRSWLASVPIFDPYELLFAPHARREAGSPRHPGMAYHGGETDLDGAVLGVLNVDSGWDYKKLGLSPNPDVHFSDQRVQAIISLMQLTALSVGGALAKVFPSKGDAP